MDAQTQQPAPQTVVSEPEKPKLGMFANLTVFSYKRDLKEAVGFYIFYLILVALLGGLLAGVFGLIIGNDSFEAGLWFGTVVAMIFSLVLSFLILYKKNLLGNFVYILIALASFLLPLLGGGLLGLIPVAYLSTK